MASAARILRTFAPPVSPAEVAVVSRSAVAVSVSVILAVFSTTPAAQTTAHTAMLSPICKLQEAPNQTNQQIILRSVLQHVLQLSKTQM